MGVLNKDLALLLSVLPLESKIDSVLTIGRLNNRIDRKFLARLGVDCEDHAFFDQLAKDLWDVGLIDSVDVSDYQGCSVVHDLGTPVPADLHRRYDLIIEGGSLEHIFQFPVAVENLVKMLKPGGTLLISTMCNNHAGHGFYQFSPELFYNIFNGDAFAEVGVFLSDSWFPGAELFQKASIYWVRPPMEVRERV